MCKRRRLHNPLSRRQHNGGFSLVEVLLALFVVALVIGAVSEVIGNSVRNANSMKAMTFARWVALNQIENYKIDVAQQKTMASPGAESGEAEMGNIEWRWLRDVSNSSSDTLLEIKVTVFRADDTAEENPVMSMKGYIATP